MGRRKNSKKDKVESPEVLKATNTKKDIETGSISDSRISTSNASTLGSTHNGSISTSGESPSSSDDDDEEEDEDEKVSLRSRTFDLREFAGMGQQQQQEGNVGRSSSPSVADTIIARGVEYGAPVVGRYLQAPNDPLIKTPPGILLNQAVAVSRNSIGGTGNKIAELQPEEFLTPRHLAVDHYNHHAVNDPGMYRSPNMSMNPPTQQYNHHVQQNPDFSSVPQLHRSMNGYNKSTSFDDFEAYRQGHHHADIPRHSLQNGVHYNFNEQYEHNGNHRKSDAVQQNGGDGGGREPKHRKKYNKKREHKKQQLKEPEESQPGLGEILSGMILGDAPLIRDFLGKRQRDFVWSPIIFFECFFRSVGSVVFASNPWTGLAIYCAMLGVIPLATLIGSITLIMSIITAIFLVQMRLHSVRAGGITFNGFLLGVVIGQFADLRCPGTYAAAVISGFVIIYLHCALEGLLKPLNLPLLNSPFNLAAFIFFTSGIADILKAESSSSSSVASDDPYSFHGVDFRNYGNLTMENMTMVKAGTTETGTMLTIPMIIEGAIFATAQIFGTRTGIASFVVTAAIFVFSPILCAQATVGAFVGTLIGSGLDEAPFNAVTSGGWAYNSFLTCGALGGFLIVLSIQSWILSVIGAVLSALVYGAMSKGNMPVLGIPFMLITWLLVASTNINSSLTTGLPNGARGTKKWMAIVKVSEHLIQTPEIHLQQFWKREPRMRRKVMPQQQGSGDRYDRQEAELHL